jgi:hypothetical protein
VSEPTEVLLSNIFELLVPTEDKTCAVDLVEQLVGEAVDVETKDWVLLGVLL